MNSALMGLGLVALVLAVFIPTRTGPILDKMPLGVVEPEQVETIEAMVWNTNLFVPWNETRDMSTVEAGIECAKIGWEYKTHRPWAKNVSGTINVEYAIHCIKWTTEFPR